MFSAHKVVLVGDSNVGKTSIATRLQSSQFHETLDPTIGSASMSVDLKVYEDTVTLDIWDTAGQERFRSLTPLYFRGAEAAVFVYDVTKAQSVAALDSFFSIFQQQVPDDCIIVVVGNKCDLEAERDVSVEEGDNIAKKFDAVFFTETSARTGQGVEMLFTRIAEEVTKKGGPTYLAGARGADLGAGGGKKKCNC